MRTFDFSPLFRQSVGFERMQRLLDAAARHDDTAYAYPPYNIEAFDDDTYRISMAVAGFGEDDISVTVARNSLVISGRIGKSEGTVAYLHRGLAARPFERRFELAEHVEVKSANLVNGLLHVDLERVVPDEFKPRTLKVGSRLPRKAKVIEKKAA